MKPEEKDLLLKDLCARLPYEPVIEYVVKGITDNAHMTCKLDVLHIDELLQDSEDLVEVKPYLRPMSSMTEEEKKEYQSLCVIYSEHDADDNVTYYYFDTVESFDWLNKNMFDCRELIPKDLALTTEVFNPYKD